MCMVLNVLSLYVQRSWAKTETDKLKDRLLQKESEIAHLRSQLKDG